MPAASGRRAELARFLRRRREKITPEEVGLPPGSRRRGTGLRREEVAMLAGLSSTWYSYLEQGRDIQPSAAVLNSIGSVLQLTEDELRYVHTLAGHPVGTQTLDTDLESDDLVRLLVNTAGRTAYPVYGANQYCDLVAWNPAATDWYDDWGALPAEERNMMRWMFCSPVARDRIIDWEDEARDVLARWRAMMPHGLANKRLQDMVDELQAQSPDFARYWHEYEVQEHRSRVRKFSHPKSGERLARMLVVQAPEFTPSFVVFHLPVLQAQPSWMLCAARCRKAQVRRISLAIRCSVPSQP